MMSHDVVVTNCCRHGPVWYSNETHNLDKYLCYKSQMISTSCFLQYNGCNKCWHWLSSCTSSIFKWPYDKSIFKIIKTFLMVWCSGSARMYDHIICGRAPLRFKLICSCTCTCIWKEETCTCTSKRSTLFFFTLYSIWTLLEHLANACTVSSCHINTGSDVRRIICKRQRCMYKSEQRYINENLLTWNARARKHTAFRWLFSRAYD